MPGRSTGQELLGYAGVFTRFPRALHRFVASPITLEQARNRVREQMDGRDASFLRLLRESVYGNPSSPYRPLLALAGCELGDAEALVAAKGIEGTLSELRAAGVYVTFEGFKGRRPIERDGRVLPVAAADSDNPARGTT